LAELGKFACAVADYGETGDFGYNCPMRLHYDLHSHSTASDGTLTPTELVERAAGAGVDVLALTDHDVTDGVAEAVAAAERIGLQLVPGTEISTTWNGRDVHVVGLQVDVHCALLQDGLKGQRELREWRAREIGGRLAKAGITDAYEGAKAQAGGAAISRTHYARFLVDRGHAKDVADAFKRHLGRGRPGYVRGEWASLEDTVGWIQAAGGHAVIAHPARYNLTASRLRLLLGEFKECGGTGIEVVTGSQFRDEGYALARLAGQLGLYASRGSDYHGPVNPWIELGRLHDLPRGCVPIWDSEQWQAASREWRVANR